MLRTKYAGAYCDFENDIVSYDLLQVQQQLEKAMGSDFREYETAWVFETSAIGRKVGSYYFSMTDKKWHFIKNDFDDYYSWSNVVFPIKQIVQFIITAGGGRSKQDFRTMEGFQRQKIDELYG